MAVKARQTWRAVAQGTFWSTREEAVSGQPRRADALGEEPGSGIANLRHPIGTASVAERGYAGASTVRSGRHVAPVFYCPLPQESEKERKVFEMLVHG